jgi:hypothetical protein
MKKYNVVLLCIALLSVLLVPLFSFSEGRVEGVVKDQDTKLPIEGAIITLKVLDKSDFYELFEFKYTTKKNGTFHFDIEPKKEIFYYIQCQKDGYIALISEYYFKYVKKELFRDMVNGFSMAEGQVKFVEICLEKGAVLEGMIRGIGLQGEYPIASVPGSLMRKTNPNNAYLKEKYRYIVNSFGTDEKGIFRIEGVEPYDYYILAVHPTGRVLEDIENVFVERGEDNYFQYTLDLTDQTGFEGYIKVNGHPPHSCTIDLSQHSKTNPDQLLYWSRIYTNKEGFFSYKGLLPGIYTLSFSGFDEDDNSFNFPENKIVEIEFQKTLLLNLEF